MVHYKVSIRWPDVVTTQVDADVDLSDYKMSTNNCGYVQFRAKAAVQLLHRMVMGLQKGDGKNIDHVKGDKLDNRRSNLRIVTPNQNMYSRRFKSVSRSGYRGVRQVPSGKWVASIRRKPSYIGTYDTKEQAALAYNKMALTLFEQATLNVKT